MMLVLMNNTSPACERLQGWLHRDIATYVPLSVILRSSLWQLDGYPPVGQDSAYAVVNNCLQTHCEESIGGDQLYHRQRASQ